MLMKPLTAAAKAAQLRRAVGTTEEAAEKPLEVEQQTSGAEARQILRGLAARPRSCPSRNRRAREFFRSLRGRAFPATLWTRVFPQRLKPYPCRAELFSCSIEPIANQTPRSCCHRSGPGGRGAGALPGRAPFVPGLFLCGSCRRWNRGGRRGRLPVR